MPEHARESSGRNQNLESNRAKLNEQEVHLTGKIDVQENELSAKFNAELFVGTIPEYEGTYEITPMVTSQTFDTKDKKLTDDMTVLAIPYYETTNTSGGDYVIKLTVTGTMAIVGTISTNQYCRLLHHATGSDTRNNYYVNAINRVEIGSGGTTAQIWTRETTGWTAWSKAWKKTASGWAQQSDLSNVFDSNTNYVKG